MWKNHRWCIMMFKILNSVQPQATLMLYLTDVILVLYCAVLHFLRGSSTQDDYNSTQDDNVSVVFGIFTIVILFIGGVSVNLFNFFRRESRLLKNQTLLKKAKKILMLFIPGQALLSWTLEWIKDPSSWSINYWVATLRIFHTSVGSLVQAVFQTFIMIRLWWNITSYSEDFTVMVVGSSVFAVHAVVGMCTYIWKEHYEEEHETIPITDFFFIFLSVSLNMCKCIVSMAMVAAVISWWFLIFVIAAPIIFNYIMCLCTTKPLCTGSVADIFFRFIMPLPIAALYAMTASKEKIATILTTVCWLGMSLPQIVKHHDTSIQWVAWAVPFVAQVVAFSFILYKWSIFEITFTRFARILSSADSDKKVNVNKNNTNGYLENDYC
ncbi:hypothetical protein OTU49_007221 [Cherax quadricarinatus]|uniref:Uncharacterized protein n=1 Tax=Cherax quadricarinatus TaxID=27406 RepID=A0AAW0WJ93_CHEQU